MNNFDVTIIGGGVAGYFAAIKLLEKNSELNILILEKQSAPLQKLLTTGSGACNFTHKGTPDDFLVKYGKNGQFLRNAFYSYFVEDIVAYFEEHGIETYCREDGKYFPRSMKAHDIKELFIRQTSTCTTQLNEKVLDIQTDKDIFTIHTEKNTYYTHSVVIATGGKSFPKTGSTGDGYSLAENLGHSIVQVKPSLASVFCDNHALGEFSGIAFENAKILHKKINKTYKGSLLITHKGFSGPVIIDNSRDFNKGDIIYISFTQARRDEIDSYLKEMKQEVIVSALKKFEIPRKLAHFLCNELQIDSTKKIGEVSYKNIERLISNIVSYPIEISNIESFDSCMCTCGGVSLRDINPKTFESKIVANLYFLGEVLDIDGDSGGYNLQAIWSQAALFAKNF